MHASIVFLTGPRTGRELILGAELAIGRDGSNDLALADESMSRRHAVVRRVGDGAPARFTVEDLGSRNGTFVNDRKVDGATELSHGDVVGVGDLSFRFVDEREAGAQTRPGRASTAPGDAAPERIEHAVSAAGVDIFRSTATTDASELGARLKVLVRLGEVLGSGLELRDLLARALELTGEVLPVDVAAIACVDELTGEPDPEETVGYPKAEDAPRVSRVILERVLGGREAILVASAAEETMLRGRESVVASGVSSAIAVPLQPRLTGTTKPGGAAATTPVGYLYLASTRPGFRYREADLELVTEMARPLGAALAARRRLRRAEEAARDAAAGPAPARPSIADGTGDAGRDGIVAESEAFRAALDLATRAADGDVSVLVLGETGTGKEVVSRLIHDRSGRSDGPFIALNCAALPESLLESELFGYERGAFSGATARRKGKLELAHGGTLFLDEVAEIPLTVQAKLLRALETREFYRLGGQAPVKSDFRIVAATNRDLRARSEAGEFREDLYYRLGVITVTLPPLRERPDDIAALARMFLAEAASRLGRKVDLADDAIVALARWRWPGNAREVRNVVERALVLADGDRIEPAHLPPEIAGGTRPGATSSAPSGDEPDDLTLAAAEKAAIARALKATGGKKGEAAKLLGVSWPTLTKKVREYGLEDPAKKG